MTTYRPDLVRARVDDLRTQLKAILEAREEADARLRAQRTEADKALEKASAAAQAELEAGRRKLAEEDEQARAAIDARHARNLERIESAFARATARVEAGLSGEKARIDEEKQRKRAEVEKRTAAADPYTAALAETAALLESTRALQDDVTALAANARVRLPDVSEVQPPGGISGGKAGAWAKRTLEESAKALASQRRDPWAPFARMGRRILLVVLVLLAHGAAALAVMHVKPEDNQTVLQVVAISGMGFLLAALLFGHAMKQRAAGGVESLWSAAAQVEALLRRRETSLKEGRMRDQEERERVRSRALAGTEEKLSEKALEAGRTFDTRVGILEDQKKQATARSEGHREGRLARQAAALEAATRRLGDWHSRALARLQSVDAERRRDLAERDGRELGELGGRWKSILEAFVRSAAQARAESLASHPAWTDPRWKAPVMSPLFPEGIRLGDVSFDLKALLSPPADDPRFALPGDGTVSLPFEAGFPGVGRLVFNADGDQRDRTLGALFSTVLRILCSLPPGKAKFTLIDPVGLGQSFSALMHLADFDESLVGGRIWTEPAHIEKRLAELTEHIEKVIQKYLRNRYHTIDEYNREVGPMAEAYRFLVVADFPTGFSELALERLASIARSGARCGVILLILRDTRQKLPPAADRATLESGGVTLDAVASGLVDRTLADGVLAVEPPPPAEALNDLLRAVGKQCAEAKRVEIPFEIIAPKTETMWSLTTEGGIRVPLGRAGADRLQQLDLGRGTAQHALIAGRTGSGKSTLFHVIIANAAAWYSPRELELYLIDFKKGVEFKTYATNALPHARVIAIESDREFGVSVLRRVYAELGRRAESFRAAGVQEFAGYRKAAPADRIPRTLLMIDEFQEFFTEEDSIAQEAALLLDRIVRQGRAFGVHVVVGSQTLGGSYTLAKSTLGQMAVRIALPCSEADSYLILSDDNAAARLLSRPGEAIYNDKSGAIEGNDPFQIAWLPDEVRDAKLRLVRERAAAEAYRAPEPPTVFEGNVPADIRKNRELAERLTRPPAAAAACAWIGEANAIKGPTEIRFKAQRGGNVLVVGQQRESALSILCSSIVGLAGGHPPSGARFIVLDGSPPELGHGRHFAELAASLPHKVDLVETARVAEVMAGLDAEVARRLESSGAGEPRIFLVIHDLQTFRKLRQGDELDFSSAEEKKKTPEKCFATVLGEGPALGIHALVWCDSLNSINRMLTRRLMKEFDVRVLFQMSATDSSELIDSPAAGKLGLYRGLLFSEEEGTVEKFRPYGLPELETLREYGKVMKAGR
jgi:hypothetical protein